MTPGESFLTSPVVGAAVMSPAGEEIGRVSDVVTDSASGRIRFAVIELRGAEKLLVVPWPAMSFRPAERAAVLDVDAETLATGPGFTREEWPRVTESRWDRQTYSHYGYQPYWEVSRTDEPDWEVSRAEEPHWEASRAEARRADDERHRHIAPVVAGALLLLVIVGFSYLVYRQGWSTTSAQVRGVAVAVRETTNAVRETSADVAVTAKVKAALALSKRVPALEINVDTQNAVATLTGKVPSLQVRDLAGEIAGDTSGVREVRNLLTVDPAARPDRERERLALRVEELEQQTAIAEALHEHPEMEGSQIKVRVAAGVVLLDGTVVSSEQKWRAEQIASSLAGARVVRNNLR
jgi:osmotically-inducible protein OsmY